MHLWKVPNGIVFGHPTARAAHFGVERFWPPLTRGTIRSSNYFTSTFVSGLAHRVDGRIARPALIEQI